MLRLHTQLDDELESLVERTIGCCIAVHRVLGPGLLERIYCRALELELGAGEIQFETQKSYPVRYRGQILCQQRLDLVVARRVAIEIKATDRLAPIHQAQLLSYLRVSKLPVGLLVNFNVPVLREGLKRIVL